MKRTLIIVAVMLWVVCGFATMDASAQQPEKVVAVYVVKPALADHNDENNIKTNLRFEKGVSDVATDIQANRVKVSYDPRKTDSDKIVAAFAGIGFEAVKVEE